MGKTTKISWCDATSLSVVMFLFVAFVAEGFTIRNIKPQFWMSRKRFAVVRTEIPPARIPASLIGGRCHDADLHLLLGTADQALARGITAEAVGPQRRVVRRCWCAEGGIRQWCDSPMARS